MSALIGLIAMGGNSTRMGMDKCWMNYHGIEQCYHAYKMLLPFCEKVYLACNAEQKKRIKPEYPIIVDDHEFAGSGPIAALLSAWKQSPEATFLLLGCDYPLLSALEIKQLIDGRNVENKITAIYNPKTSFYEPLLAIYEAETAKYFLDAIHEKRFSLQSIIQNLNAKKVFCDSDKIKSFDSFKDVNSHFPKQIRTHE